MLRGLRGEGWQALVDRVAKLPETHEETLAFMLTMIRLNGCVNCEMDSFRALRGCATCAVQVLRRYKGDDSDLLALYERALNDLRAFRANDPRYLQIVGETAAAMPQ
jgi:hypothetical protein